MNGVDPGQIAQNFITYFGGASGGYIVAAALILVGILSLCHIVHARLFWITMSLGILAWTGSWAVRTLIGWT
jgi:hypothetical protein